MSALQILDCEIERADGERIRADVLVDSGRIARLSPAGQLGHDATGDTTLVADGAALLPSLHDHHIHLFALAAWRASIDCSPTRVGTSDQLAEALRNAAPLQTEPLRAVGYHESIAGDLDRSRLDVLAAGRAVRIQHRTGALWVLNSSALEAAGLADEAPDEGWPEGAEVDANGRSNGRFFRLDDWLSERLARANAERPAPDLSEVSRELAASGVASLTDATPRNDLRTARTFSAAWSSGALLQRVRMMSAAPPTSALSELIENSTGRLTWGERKVVLDDRDLPSLDEVAEQIAEAHAQGRGVAIHCVTRSELVLAAGALEQAGVRTGDRIEHASIAAPDAVDWLAQLGVRVVTQPGFIADRGDDYLRDVEAKDRPWLYRCAGRRRSSPRCRHRCALWKCRSMARDSRRRRSQDTRRKRTRPRRSALTRARTWLVHDSGGCTGREAATHRTRRNCRLDAARLQLGHSARTPRSVPRPHHDLRRTRDRVACHLGQSARAPRNHNGRNQKTRRGS